MAPQSEVNQLQSVWRALSGEGDREGWRTVSLGSSGLRRILAGRHFPGNEEGILVGFNDLRVPSENSFPQGQGFLVERVKHQIPSDANVWISLSRHANGNLEIFTQMTMDILRMLETYQHVDNQTLFQFFLGRVRAWQEFMRRGRIGVLGPEAEIGLAGELCFLRQLFQCVPQTMGFLDGWQGPLGGIHDFVIGSGVIEVKSTIVKNGFPATITSLEQLDASLVSPLFLAGVRFALDDSGKTLTEIITDLSTQFSSYPDKREQFELLILRAGFLWTLSDRYNRRFLHLGTKIMLVDGEFPALTRHRVHPAIAKARYELDLDLVPALGVDLEKALEVLGVTA